jgi:prepilin-type N-terminal cleavage/methylation domain-containing protein
LDNLSGTIFVETYDAKQYLPIKEIKTMRRDAGFSLMELMTVLAIMAILSTIAIPSLFKWLPKQRVGSAAREVKSTLEFARASAIKRNMLVEVDFDWTNDSLTVVEVIDPDPVPPIYGDTLRTRQLPADVNLKNDGLGSPVTFNGHGFAPGSNGSVVVENTSNTALRRSINMTVGGNTRIQ